jgi:hypothetical protein
MARGWPEACSAGYQRERQKSMHEKPSPCHLYSQKLNSELRAARQRKKSSDLILEKIDKIRFLSIYLREKAEQQAAPCTPFDLSIVCLSAMALLVRNHHSTARSA